MSKRHCSISRTNYSTCFLLGLDGVVFADRVALFQDVKLLENVQEKFVIKQRVFELAGQVGVVDVGQLDELLGHLAEVGLDFLVAELRSDVLRKRNQGRDLRQIPRGGVVGAKAQPGDGAVGRLDSSVLANGDGSARPAFFSLFHRAFLLLRDLDFQVGNRLARVFGVLHQNVEKAVSNRLKLFFRNK